MHSHESIQTAINGKTIEHAKALHLSPSTLHKWQEPCADFTDSGCYNPLDRIETIVETSISHGTSLDKALAPVQYLNERFGLVVLSLPAEKATVNSCEKELLHVIEEFGDLARESAKALSDGKLRRRKFERIEKEGWEAIRKIAGYIKRVEEAADGGEQNRQRDKGTRGR